MPFHIGIDFAIGPFFGLSGAVAYFLNALGIATKGVQTASLPSESLALDYTGTLVDFGGAPNTEGTNVAAVPGSRLATTVAEGAVLGEESWDAPSISSEWVDNADGTYTLDGSQTTYPVLKVSSPPAFVLYGDYKTVFTITDITSGWVRYKVGTKSGTLRTVAGVFDEVITHESIDDAIYLQADPNFIGTISISIVGVDVSVKQVIPTILDTDTSGNDLHPYTTVNGVKNYTFHPAHKVSTAYSAGDKVFAEASDGVRHYYSASAGTTGATAPTFPTSGTVADGGVTWTEEGLYTLRGQRVEGSATNLLPYSQDLSAWSVARVSVTTDALIAPDGTTTAIKIVDDTTAASTHYLIVVPPALVLNEHHTASIYLKAGERAWARVAVRGEDSTINDYVFFDLANGVVGSNPSPNGDLLGWGIDTVGAGGWYRCWVSYSSGLVDDTAPLFTIYLADADDSSAYDGDGISGIYAWQAQLEQSEFPSSHIKTEASAVTRQAVNIDVDIADTDLSASSGAGRLILTPTATGQTGTLLSSYTDASNYTSVEATPTTITLNKMVGGVLVAASKTYTHAKDQQFVVDFKYDSAGMAVNVFAIGETAGASGTNADTSDAVLSTTLQIGGKNDTNHMNATYDDMMFFTTEAEASSQYSDWSN